MMIWQKESGKDKFSQLVLKDKVNESKQKFSLCVWKYIKWDFNFNFS